MKENVPAMRRLVDTHPKVDDSETMVDVEEFGTIKFNVKKSYIKPLKASDKSVAKTIAEILQTIDAI